MCLKEVGCGILKRGEQGKTENISESSSMKVNVFSQEMGI